MLERILDNYFSKKLKEVISRRLFFQYFLDTKFIDDKNKFLIKVKRTHYNEKQFKCIWWIWKSDSVERYINIDKTFEILQEIIDDYLKDNP